MTESKDKDLEILIENFIKEDKEHEEKFKKLLYNLKSEQNSVNKEYIKNQIHKMLVGPVEFPKRDKLIEYFNQNKLIQTKNPDLNKRIKNLFEEYPNMLHGINISDDDLLDFEIDLQGYKEDLYELVNTVNPKDFYRRGKDIIPLAHTQNIPHVYTNLFKDVEQSFRLGLFNTVAIFCRSIIETGMKKYYKDINDKWYLLAKNEQRVTLLNLIKNLQDIGLFDRSELEKVHFIRKIANDILHKGITISEDTAFKVLKYTRFAVEKLFNFESSK